MKGRDNMAIIQLYIIEDDDNACKRFIEYTENIPDINIVGYSGSSRIALKQIEQHKPDAIILDFELAYGEGDGLTMIPNIVNLSKSHKPFILVTTNNPSTVVHAHARSTGADYIMLKFQKGYSELAVLNFLSSLKNTIVPLRDNTPTPSVLTDHERDKLLLTEITDILNNIGIKPSLKGFDYLKLAIFHSLFTSDDNIFEYVGNHFKLKPQSAQRAMQNAIDTSYSNNSNIKKYYTGYCNPETNIPSAINIIRYFADNIKNNHPDLFDY